MVEIKLFIQHLHTFAYGILFLLPLGIALEYGGQNDDSIANGGRSKITPGQEASMGQTLSNKPVGRFNDPPYFEVDSPLPDCQSCSPQLQTQDIRPQRREYLPHSDTKDFDGSSGHLIGSCDRVQGRTFSEVEDDVENWTVVT